MNKPFTLCKIYNDGSHFIAMPYIRDPDDEVDSYYKKQSNRIKYKEFASIDVDHCSISEKINHARYLFEENYNYAMSLDKSSRFDLYYEMLSFAFPDRKACDRFVQRNLNRRFKNFIYRRLRMIRKCNLIRFDYFCTFTYDSEKMDEQEFRKKILYFLNNKATRDNWKYIGVFERGSKTERLHLHCLLKADQDTIPGDFVSKRKWNSKVKMLKTVKENDYILDRFGQNDFSPIDYEDPADCKGRIDYLLKYIEKSGEKLIYSRGLFQFLVSNIDDEDVAFTRYQPCVKLVLFDDFKCYNEFGCLVGVCSEETFQKLRRSNK